MKTHSVFALVIAAACAILFATITLGQSNRVHVMWEYGELIVRGEQAYFATQEEFHELHPPSQKNHGGRSHATNWGRVHHQTSIKLLHLNRLGSEGWELVSTAAIEDGIAYTVRRNRR